MSSTTEILEAYGRYRAYRKRLEDDTNQRNKDLQAQYDKGYYSQATPGSARYDPPQINVVSESFADFMRWLESDGSPTQQTSEHQTLAQASPSAPLNKETL